MKAMQKTKRNRASQTYIISHILDLLRLNFRLHSLQSAIVAK